MHDLSDTDFVVQQMSVINRVKGPGEVKQDYRRSVILDVSILETSYSTTRPDLYRLSMPDRSLYISISVPNGSDKSNGRLFVWVSHKSAIRTPVELYPTLILLLQQLASIDCPTLTEDFPSAHSFGWIPSSFESPSIVSDLFY
ncbi:hypothetical protein CDAR_533201 [Caerostris darwini]|uniref:Uncharacterized protein n=1 Tax=Caerostris darwini TaxID=1538125 RepID=A0AAV4SHN0_9ARAC|nr:hypothetical protein CDAR_533201 [Caerostris darwini]